MLKIGLLIGREWSWPPAFVEEVNRRDSGVIVERVQLGGTRMDEPCPYVVIVDRISHEVPYYRSYLKSVTLQGTHVINNPFMWTADDKFFGATLVTRLGIASPKTVALPNKDYIPGIVHDESLSNLIFPLNWEQLVDYVGGFPCVLKDAHGGGWKNVSIVHSLEELWERYNESGLLTMILQEFIRWDQYLRCMCLGREEIKVMKYEMESRRYLPPDLSPEMHQRVVEESLKIVRALGYDMNTIEWAIRDGTPYAIDFMNPAPDMDINTTGLEYHRWCVEGMADLCIRLAKEPRPQVNEIRWTSLFSACTATFSEESFMPRGDALKR
jgi:hypothetical protein